MYTIPSAQKHSDLNYIDIMTYITSRCHCKRVSRKLDVFDNRNAPAYINKLVMAFYSEIRILKSSEVNFASKY